IDGAYLLESLVVAGIAAGGVSGTQIVEQVGRYREVYLHLVVLHDVVSDCSRQVSLACTESALQQEPAFGMGGKVCGSVVRLPCAGHFRIEVGEYLLLESVKVAQPVEVFQVALLGGLSAAYARIKLTEAWVAH